MAMQLGTREPVPLEAGRAEGRWGGIDPLPGEAWIPGMSLQGNAFTYASNFVMMSEKWFAKALFRADRLRSEGVSTS
jgi:hypothetical protein